MIEPLALIRALHYATTLLATGMLEFELLIARGGVARHRGTLVAATCLAFASAFAWLVVQTQNASGGSLIEALDPTLFSMMLTATAFGHVWVVRLVLLALWPIVLVVAKGWPGSALAAFIGLAATVLLAFAGHAADGGVARQVNDMLHLALAATWLGGLLPLAEILRMAARSPSTETAARAHAAAQRFTPLGIVCVGGLLATGLTNASALVGSIPALIGTAYGRLLLAKLAALSAMIVLALINRTALTPALATSAKAAQRLARNAIAETALGIFILADVSVLGISVPAEHDRILWPLPVAWSLGAIEDNTGRTLAAYSAATIAILGVIVLLSALLTRPRRALWLGFGGALLVLALGTSGFAFAVPAVPTLYQASPVPYTVDAVMAGKRLYDANCASCHGPHGYGDGPLADSLKDPPADIAEDKVGYEPDGLLFWRIGAGMPGTPMPGFAKVLDDERRWQVLAFLHAQADGEMARMTDMTMRFPAPDFAFETADGSQDTLAAERGKHAVLLVLYDLPASQTRLDVLTAAAPMLDQAGLRIVAMAAGPAKASDPIAVTPDPAVVAAYRMYDRDQNPPLEFLIDRWGTLRAIWAGDDAVDPKTLKAMVERLAREPEPAASHAGHVH